MTEFYVDNLSYALGSVKRTVDESAKSDTFSSAKLLRDSGFETHHLAAEGESVFDLAAVRRSWALARRGTSLRQ